MFLDPDTTLVNLKLVQAFDPKSGARAKFDTLLSKTREAIKDEDKLPHLNAIADLVFGEGMFLPVFQMDRVDAMKNHLTRDRTLYRYSPRLSDLRSANGH